MTIFHLNKLAGGMLATTIALCVSAAHAQMPQSQPGSAPSSGMSAAKATGATALNQADQKILKDLASANLTEIDMAKLAQTHAKSAEVRNYSQRMLDNHTRVLQEVQTIAKAKAVTLPTAPEAKRKEEMKKLSTLTGDAFDRRYMSQEIADLKEMQRQLQQSQTRATDAEVRTLTVNTLPVIDQALSMAQQTHAAIEQGTPSTGTSGTSGTTGISGSAIESGATGVGSSGAASEATGASGMSESPASGSSAPPSGTSSQSGTPR